MEKKLPPVRQIKSTNEIKVGDTLLYTGNPRGTGLFVPEIGAMWKMESEGDIVQASIEIIERGRGWRPIDNPQNTSL